MSNFSSQCNAGYAGSKGLLTRQTLHERIEPGFVRLPAAESTEHSASAPSSARVLTLKISLPLLDI